MIHTGLSENFTTLVMDQRDSQDWQSYMMTQKYFYNQNLIFKQ
jgi:hypothetical protein